MALTWALPTQNAGVRFTFWQRLCVQARPPFWWFLLPCWLLHGVRALLLWRGAICQLQAGRLLQAIFVLQPALQLVFLLRFFLQLPCGSLL